MGNLKTLIFLGSLLIGLSTCFKISGNTLSKRHGQRSNPDLGCILENCMTQLTACVESSLCRDNLLCVLLCGGSNDTCLYECVNTFDNDVFDNLMKCMVRDYPCLELESPDPTFRCTKPNQVVLSFNMSQFEGAWYVSLGLNKQHDCFDCQVSTFTPTPNSTNYTLTAHYDVPIANGSVRHRVDVEQIKQKNPVFGGLLDDTNTVMGLSMKEKWQVTDFSPDGQYIIVYYCGNMTADWWYEGSLVFTRQPVLDPKYLPNVTRTVESMGHQINEYCTKDNTGCTTSQLFKTIY